MPAHRSLTLVSPYGAAAPSTRIRLYEWDEHLGLSARRSSYAGFGNNGLSTLARNPVAAARAEWATRRSVSTLGDSVVVLSREASPWSRGGVESRLLRGAGRGVYDLDDALFADVQGWRRALGKQVKCRRAIESADHVIVGNDYLAEYAAQYSGAVSVIPTCVEPSAYQPKRSYDLSDPPVLVWLGSGSTERYLEGVAPALRELNRATGATLKLISGPKPAGHVELGDFVHRVRWDPDTVAAELASADIALGPLPDTGFSRGKCAYKLLQYAATGLPMVGSPVGANELALGRFRGLAATGDGEWVEALTDLVRASATERAERGAAALEAVRRHYSFEVWAGSWRAAVGI